MTILSAKQKTFLVHALRRCYGYFLMYALLPLLCLFLFLTLGYVRSTGIPKQEAPRETIGDHVLFSLTGSRAEPIPIQTGFYFLSPELPLPLKGGVRKIVGCATYFSSLLLPTPPTSPEKPEDPPETDTIGEENSTEEEKKPAFIFDSLPAEAVPIVAVDLSSPSYYLNSTQYSIDIEKARREPFPSETKPSSDGPLVLVVHTHGTESYFEDNSNLSDFAQGDIETYFLHANTAFRTTDPEKSVVQVGKVFCETLESEGIPTLHCTVMHDRENFNDAYTNCANTVKALLRQYPTIQYVIDLHRDSITRGEAYVKTRASVSDTDCAQVMLVVGTRPRFI